MRLFNEAYEQGALFS
ncbi:hypothetical protein [Methanosarcina sp. 2.H.A.1B.4]